MTNVRKRRNIDSALTSKGFVKANLPNGHFSYQLEVDGKITNIRTKMSMGRSHKELGKNLIAKMAKDLKMQTKNFIDYVVCTYSYDDYLEVLKENKCL